MAGEIPSRVAVLIPAVKKSVAFPDDLVKKLAGTALIQRAIDKAVESFSADAVQVATDSEEIRLICERAGVGCHYEATLRLDEEAYLESLAPALRRLAEHWEHLLVLSPYVPLIGVGQLRDAYRHFIEVGAELLVPVSRAWQRLYSPWRRPLARVMHEGAAQELVSESHAFTILARSLLEGDGGREVLPVAYPVEGRLLEIRSYEDWWICEKLLNRRRIVFRVIGNRAVGMGHIYRCLALAHEISDHEIRFVCDSGSGVVANKLAGYDYWLGVYPPEGIDRAILALEPDLVVNDILNTEVDYVRRLRDHGVRVVNFEDLGPGAAEADFTVNDLYDEPQIPGERILWGHDWFFVRDEFTDARPHTFGDRVNRLLIAFGGTDPSDLTRKVLQAVAPYCAERGVAIDIVTGDGYGHHAELEAMIAALADQEVTHTHATGVISQLMERAEIAISSNGRTVYELAHMNLPAIVLSHHPRENTHRFAREENGFIPLGMHQGERTDAELREVLRRLVDEAPYRRRLFDAQRSAHFTANKSKVVRRMLALIEELR
ncbi:cytidylyltransferase domain-containing protein [Endothiovibrio diazotrophicus]